MQIAKRPVAFWFIVSFLAVSVFLMLLGQTMAVFNYDLVVRMGLQESFDQVGDFGIQVNRAFGVGDTVVFVPLLVVSLLSLLRKKRWSLLFTAAVFGVSAYWSVTVSSIFLFAPGTPGYDYVPGLEIWLFVGTYFAVGGWGLFYIALRGDDLLR